MLTIYYTQLNIDSVTSGTSWHNCHSIYIQESPACILQVGGFDCYISFHLYTNLHMDNIYVWLAGACR